MNVFGQLNKSNNLYMSINLNKIDLLQKRFLYFDKCNTQSKKA